MPLYNQITRLRKALGDEDRIRAAPPGYLIRVEPGELDLHVFAEKHAAGRRALAARSWVEASRRFGEALALWRGRPLADIPALADDPRVRELEETHIQALQGRNEADLNLGRHHELIGELRALIPEHPRHEAFRGQLMLALHRAGQADDAAAEYDAYQESLREELGLEPGTELPELRDAIERRDPALTLPANPDAPRQLPGGHAHVHRPGRGAVRAGPDGAAVLGPRWSSRRSTGSAASARPRWPCTPRTASPTASLTASCSSTCAAIRRAANPCPPRTRSPTCCARSACRRGRSRPNPPNARRSTAPGWPRAEP